MLCGGVGGQVEGMRIQRYLDGDAFSVAVAFGKGRGGGSGKGAQ